MRLLVYDIQGKIFVKARHFKKLSASRVKILARGKLQNLQLLLHRYPKLYGRLDRVTFDRYATAKL